MHNTNETTLNPYLHFAGNCKEAMNFYKTALKAELKLIPFEGSPMAVPDDYKSKIMHATLTFGKAVLMASDGMPGQEFDKGTNCSISIASSDVTEADAFFNALAKGGSIIMPFEKTFWGAKFGMLSDQFGIIWMINCELGDTK